MNRAEILHEVKNIATVEAVQIDIDKRRCENPIRARLMQRCFVVIDVLVQELTKMKKLEDNESNSSIL